MIKGRYFPFLMALTAAAAAQDFPATWSQSYATYDIPAPYSPGSYGLGLGIDNFCLYIHPDSFSYDERRFDLWTRVGLPRGTEVEIRYSYPTAGLVSLKCRFLSSPRFGGASIKLGAGYMKGTREGRITDYVYDLYPALLLCTGPFKQVTPFLAPKMIYSIHTRDIQERSDRPARLIFHYGFGAGFVFGGDFQVIVESNWCWGNNEGVRYMVNQFGLGTAVLIR